MQMLGSLISDADLRALVLTRRHEVLLSGVGTMRGTEMEFQRPVRPARHRCDDQPASRAGNPAQDPAAVSRAEAARTRIAELDAEISQYREASRPGQTLPSSARGSPRHRPERSRPKPRSEPPSASAT